MKKELIKGKDLKIAMIGHKHIPSREGGVEERYENVAKGIIPENIQTIELSNVAKEISIIDLLIKVSFAKSRSEAKRMVQGKSVKINGELVEDIQSMVKLDKEINLQFGKNKFVKVK